MTDKASCECIGWARIMKRPITNHHENCEHYVEELRKESVNHLTIILNHYRDYCNEGDGIPPEAWEDYKRALLFIGDIARFQKCLEYEKENNL